MWSEGVGDSNSGCLFLSTGHLLLHSLIQSRCSQTAMTQFGVQGGGGGVVSCKILTDDLSGL